MPYEPPLHGMFLGHIFANMRGAGGQNDIQYVWVAHFGGCGPKRNSGGVRHVPDRKGMC